MTLTDEVAKAICKSRSCVGIHCCEWPANMGRRHACTVDGKGFDDAARAAIAVFARHLREPSEEMIEAAINAGWGEDNIGEISLDRKGTATILRALATHIGGEVK